MKSTTLTTAILCAATTLATTNPLHAENRTIDGSNNHTTATSKGAAGQPFTRFGYEPTFPIDGSGSTIITDTDRGNPRDISNALSTQTTSITSARNLTDFIWVWGQFLDHDITLATTDNGPAINGAAPIAVNNPADPLGPNPIPFTRSDFHLDENGIRQNSNSVTTWIDASNVYGSDATRAAALRTHNGTGPKILLSHNDLLPFNTPGLPNANAGPTPPAQLFLSGDVRANENVLLTSMHTIFSREHNRIADAIQAQNPYFDHEQTYQLARKIVGAQMQIITYNEFLPALLGDTSPKATDYNYDPDQVADITQSFAAAAYRYGHSTLSSNLPLVDDQGNQNGNLTLAQAFFNPNLIKNEPTYVDQLLKGAATQISQEVDTLIIDDVRNMLFGPPGAGGLDLAALNIQRGRDHGLPDYNTLRPSYGLPPVTAFEQITDDTALASKLQDIYTTVDNIDPWIGALAEDHLPGSSVGPLIDAIVADQFERLRDADRLFYLNDDLGLYTDGRLNDHIASIINLDTITLSDIILANTSLTNLQPNVFLPVPEPTSALALAATGLFLITTRKRQNQTA